MCSPLAGPIAEFCLRVIDGSALPRVVRGPTNAPIMMMAEKVTDDLRGRPTLPFVSADVMEADSHQNFRMTLPILPARRTALGRYPLPHVD